MPSDNSCNAKEARRNDWIGRIDEIGQRRHVLKFTKSRSYSRDILFIMVRDKIQLQSLEKKTIKERSEPWGVRLIISYLWYSYLNYHFFRNKSSVDRNDLRVWQFELFFVCWEKIFVHSEIVLNIPCIDNHILESFFTVNLELTLSSVVKQKVERFIIPKYCEKYLSSNLSL